MILLNLRLLRRTHRVAEKQRNFFIALIVILKRKNIRELAAIVTQENSKQIGNGNAGITQKGLQGEKLGGSFGSRLVFQE